jgi:predicted phosphohydrolase
MKIWAIADLHLACGVPAKNMSVFGPLWEGYMEKIEQSWREKIGTEDLVLIAGDISWGMRLEEAILDLQWIDKLPGTKVIIKGNHDYWWSSLSKLSKVMPPSIHLIQNSAFDINGVTIGGARLWDTDEYNFRTYIHFQDNPREKKESKEEIDDAKIFERELERLRLSLKQLDPHAKLRIAMTHYPPISADLKPSRASQILEEFNIDICIFGHLHNLKKDRPMFGEAGGVKYLLTSCDYLNFIPVEVFK